MRRLGIHWSGLAAVGALLAAARRRWKPTCPRPRPRRAIKTSRRCVQLRHLSPVEYFRGLLGMSPGERERALANKSPADRASPSGQVAGIRGVAARNPGGAAVSNRIALGIVRPHEARAARPNKPAPGSVAPLPADG